MKQLIQSGLFSFFRETTSKNISTTEWEQAYESFADTVFEANARSNNRATYHNSLCYARAELAGLQGWDGLKK
ncbi:hypothetical protein FACS189426_06030 [Bacteroidia bacterium]|nr:hypothetical protein FACS189426_06030 [Bacteroidia bacterium]GHV10231.1 hypothetical protein FACS1894162_3250 [Bacteroidia bacterium]GHV21060.1 hypothetical protein FACS189428_0960 [Clostridia bacterium]GHV70801.1 hypothetical protein FACS189420_3400 [Bacteroidia bacterium]